MWLLLLPRERAPAPAPRADFGFDARQRDRMLGGWIAAAFYLVGAPAAILFGWLSDRVDRCRLLFAAVVLGEPAALRRAALQCCSAQARHAQERVRS